MLQKALLSRNVQILMHFKKQGLFQDNQDLSGTFPGPSGPSGQFSIFDRRHSITSTHVALVKSAREVFRVGQMT